MTLRGVKRVSRASCSSWSTDNNHSSLFSRPFFPPVCVHIMKCNLPLSGTSWRSQLSNVCCCQFSCLVCSPRGTVAGNLLFTKTTAAKTAWLQDSQAVPGYQSECSHLCQTGRRLRSEFLPRVSVSLNSERWVCLAWRRTFSLAEHFLSVFHSVFWKLTATA